MFRPSPRARRTEPYPPPTSLRHRLLHRLRGPSTGPYSAIDAAVFDIFDSEPTGYVTLGAPPTPAPIDPTRRGLRISTGATLAGGSAVLAAATGFVALALIFPWLRPGFGDAAAGQIGPEDVAAMLNIEPGRATPAEQVLVEVLGTSLPTFDGWSDVVSREVATTSLAFGCDTVDGLAPFVAASRSLVSEKGTGPEAVTLTLRAYGAGGGAVALDGISAGAAACDPAFLATAPGLGVEALAVSTTRTATWTWRRGDVLVTAAFEDSGRAGSLTQFASAWTAVDEALEQSLSGECIDPEAGAEAAGRSPYLDRARYRGYFETDQARAERDPSARAERKSLFPVVDIPPADPPSVPVLDDLPSVPVPAPTRGPERLPAPLSPPVAPTTPVEPVLVAEVEYEAEDRIGPGCGWDFTALAAPRINEATAEKTFDRDYRAATKMLTQRWRAWQKAKVAYYRAWSRYLDDVAVYVQYAEAVAEVREAWEVIAAARAEYQAALDVWQAEVDAFEAWAQALTEAEADYEAALVACEEQANAPVTPTPTATPTRGPTAAPTTPSPTPTQPSLVCPPPRPAALDAPTPTVGSSPVPDEEAQLPTK